MAVVRSQHPRQNSRVGRADRTGTGEDIAGSASHVSHSTDQFVANTPDIAATANTADIAGTVDIEHPNMDRSSRDHKLALVHLGCLEQAKPTE